MEPEEPAAGFAPDWQSLHWWSNHTGIGNLIDEFRRCRAAEDETEERIRLARCRYPETIRPVAILYRGAPYHCYGEDDPDPDYNCVIVQTCSQCGAKIDRPHVLGRNNEPFCSLACLEVFEGAFSNLPIDNGMSCDEY